MYQYWFIIVLDATDRGNHCKVSKNFLAVFTVSL